MDDYHYYELSLYRSPSEFDSGVLNLMWRSSVSRPEEACAKKKKKIVFKNPPRKLSIFARTRISRSVIADNNGHYRDGLEK